MLNGKDAPTAWLPSTSYSKTRLDGLAKSADGLAHGLWRRSRKGRTEEQVLWRFVMLCREPGAPSDEGALLDAEMENLLFYLENAALPCIRVELVVDPEPLLQRLGCQ